MKGRQDSKRSRSKPAESRTGVRRSSSGHSLSMADKPLPVGTRVEITGKGVQGVVAFVGTTTFSTGKWVGIVLEEPRGKNNGTIEGKTYFQCADNHGLFVRQSQLTILDDELVSSSEGTATGSGQATPAATTPSNEEKKE
ncbi:Dynactin subunit 1 [Chamberlinius hualienensis]